MISRARSGDDDAFAKLIAAHRAELQLHCYRMLGSLQDAEDALQETLVAAWEGLKSFEGRASLRAWLYRIATNRCLNARRAAKRRPPKAWDIPGVLPLAPTGLGEITWLEPYPDNLLEYAISPEPGPDVRFEQSESVSLAFVTALQALPPRQLAVLVLRDVLGFQADEVAQMLASTVDSANSALKRARAGVEAFRRSQEDGRRPAAPQSRAEVDLTHRFVAAWQSADLDALVALLTDDVFISMPPIPLEYEGIDLVARFCGNLFTSGRRFDLLPTRANGQPAFGAYLRGQNGGRPGVGLYVLTLRGDRVSAMTRFESHVLPWFKLPPSHPETIEIQG